MFFLSPECIKSPSVLAVNRIARFRKRLFLLPQVIV